MESSLGRNMTSISTNTRTRVPDYASGVPINSTENERSSHTALPQSFGSATGWANIWNHNPIGVGGGFGSTVRDSSRHRENGTYMNTASESTERKAGSGSLVPSESDRWNLNRTPWGDSGASNMPSVRSSGVSPARRRSTAQVQSSQQYVENAGSSYFQVQRQQSMTQGSVAKPAGSLLDPTSVNFSTTRPSDSLTNGFSNFGGFGQADSNQRSEGTAGSWPDAGSINSPTEDRRSATASEYGFGPSSAAQSRSGSLPPSRHGTELQFGQASDSSYSRFGQPSRGPNPSFSQANGRALQERSGSMQSESNNALFGRMSIDHELDAASMHRPSLSMNGLPPGTSFAPSNSEQYSRDSYAELLSHTMGMRPEDAAYIQSGAYTPDSYMNGQLSETTLQLRSFQFDSRSAPNGSGVRQSPHYSHAHTPPVIDHLYPSRSDQSLANGNNIALVENKLQRLQQSQQDRRSYMNSHPFQPQQSHQLQHLLAANQFRHPYHPYQNYLHNAIGASGLSPNVPVSNLSGMMPMIEAPSAPRDREPGESINIMSKLLCEFKATSKTSKRWELKDIWGHIVEFSGDQHGSRFIQQKLETANSEEKENVFRELQGNSLQLMMDVFGNYVIQKIFEHGDQNQKRILANRMKGNVASLSTGMYGCRVVQKALEHVLTDQQALLVQELEHDVLRCVRDQNGNHVIQKAIERVPAEHIPFIIQAFKGQIGAFAVHGYGCRVIQRMLEHYPEPAKASVLQELHAEGSRLISDQYGNYVIQHVIEYGGPEDKAKVFEMVKAQLLAFSKHKFASNVVEKCLKFGSDTQRRELMLTIAEKPERGESTTMMLIKDAYGNYVLQKLLKTLCRKDFDEFVILLRPEVDDAKKLGVSLKQVASVEKQMHRSFDDDPVPDEPHPRTSISSATDISTASTLTPNTDGQSPGSSGLPTEVTTPDKTVYNTSTASKEFSIVVEAGIAPDT